MHSLVPEKKIEQLRGSNSLNLRLSGYTGVFWEQVFCALGTPNRIAELFRLEEQKPVIWAQMIDGNIVVELKNPYKDIDVPMISTGE